MFGPDKCGTSNARTHVIFNYPAKGEDHGNLLIKKDVKMEKDQASHLYTLHVKADGSFEVRLPQCTQTVHKSFGRLVAMVVSMMLEIYLIG